MKWLRRLVWLVCVSVLLAAGAWVFRAPILVGLAKTWMVDDPLTHADAIVVLGGGLDTRTFAAARLYHEGYAPKILILSPKPRPSEESGATPTEVDVTKRILTKDGVPPDALLVVGKDVLSTRDEALAIQDWVNAGHARCLIIPTEIFHTRRVSWVFGKALKDTAEIRVTSVVPREYRLSDWWQHEQGLINFLNEAVKYAYYRLKY